MGRVYSLNIICGICLGISLGLGLFQHLVKGHALFGHPGENVVGRTVQDAEHGLDIVCNQSFTYRLDHRYSACHAGFKAYLHVIFRRGPEYLVAVHGKQSLIGSYHVFAPAYCIEHKSTGGFQSPDKFYEDVDIRIIHNHAKIVSEYISWYRKPSVAFQVLVAYPLETYRAACSLFQEFHLFQQYSGCSASYRSKSQKGYINLFAHISGSTPVFTLKFFKTVKPA